MSIPKIVRIASYSILFFIIIFIVLVITLNILFNKKIIETIKEQISKSTNNEYTLSVDELSINFNTQSIIINNLVIQPSKKQIHIKNQYLIKIKVLKIINFSIMSYVKNHAILINRVEFEDPHISIYQGTQPLSKNDEIKKNICLTKKINSIKIGHIDIVNTKFTIYKNGTDPSLIFYSNNNSIMIRNLNFEKKSVYADKFEIIMNNFSYQFDDGLYTLYAKRLCASYNDSTLFIDSLNLIPNYSKKEFSQKAGRQINRTQIITPRVICRKINYKLFCDNHKLDIKKIELNGCNIDMFRDNTWPLAPIVRPSLQAMVKNLPLYVSVDTIQMKNGSLKFETLSPGAVATGKISVNKINVNVIGIQNDTSIYSDNQSIKAVINGCVSNQGKFIETYTFPLKSTKEFFYCSGSITSMPMTSFNTIISHTKHVSIRSGQLDYLSFSFVANENSSSGTMQFKYHNLEVDILNERDKRKGLIVMFKSLLLNSFLIKDSNPGKDGIVRISKIHTIHNPYRYFLIYSMHSILSGIEPAVIGEKMQRIKNRNKKTIK